MKQKLSDSERAVLFLFVCREKQEWNKADQIRLLSGLCGWTLKRAEQAFLELESSGAAQSATLHSTN